MAIGDDIGRVSIDNITNDLNGQHLTVTNFRGTSVYIDEEGRVIPTVSAVIKRMERKGAIHPPVTSTDGYERTAENPELIWWYSRILGELAHDRIADEVDDEYDSDLQGIARRLRNCVGIEGNERDVIGELYLFRRHNVRSRLLDQAEKDLEELMRSWHSWWEDTLRRRWEVLAAERRFIVELRNLDALYGVRPDMLVYDAGEDETIGISLKTGHRITDAHRVQAAAMFRLGHQIDRVITVRLDGRYPETEEYTHESEQDRDSPNFGLYYDFCDEVRQLYRTLN